MGFYKMAGMYNNKPYFKQMDVKGKGLYLSYYEHGFYGVCKELGGGHYLKCAEKTNWLSPSSCWQYYNGKIMTNDDDLKVQAVSSVVPCGNITIKLEGQAKICQKNVEGEYVPTGQYSAGRIVFKHSQRNLYLHCRPGYNEWYVTPELQSGNSRIESASIRSLCPADYRNNYRTNTGLNAWMLENYPEWNEGNISLKCSVHSL